LAKMSVVKTFSSSNNEPPIAWGLECEYDLLFRKIGKAWMHPYVSDTRKWARRWQDVPKSDISSASPNDPKSTCCWAGDPPQWRQDTILKKLDLQKFHPTIWAVQKMYARGEIFGFQKT
jgi:hypothetical protein